jgi:hypothetical protein
MCDECEAIWLGPQIDVPPHFPEQPEIPCPHCQVSLLSEQSKWADNAKVKELEWDSHIVGTGSRLGDCEPNEDKTDE